jgi:hypothetical protein
MSLLLYHNKLLKLTNNTNDDFIDLYCESYVQIICTITLGRPTARVGQKYIWVGQARIWVGHGLPGLIARTAPETMLFIISGTCRFILSIS